MLIHRIKGIQSLRLRWGLGAQGSRFSPNLLRKLTTLHHWLRSKTTRKNGLAEISVSM